MLYKKRKTFTISSFVLYFCFINFFCWSISSAKPVPPKNLNKGKSISAKSWIDKSLLTVKEYASLPQAKQKSYILNLRKQFVFLESDWRKYINLKYSSNIINENNFFASLLIDKAWGGEWKPASKCVIGGRVEVTQSGGTCPIKVHQCIGKKGKPIPNSFTCGPIFCGEEAKGKETPPNCCIENVSDESVKENLSKKCFEKNKDLNQFISSADYINIRKALIEDFKAACLTPAPASPGSPPAAGAPGGAGAGAVPAVPPAGAQPGDKPAPEPPKEVPVEPLAPAGFGDKSLFQVIPSFTSVVKILKLTIPSNVFAADTAAADAAADVSAAEEVPPPDGQNVGFRANEDHPTYIPCHALMTRLRQLEEKYKDDLKEKGPADLDDYKNIKNFDPDAGAPPAQGVKE